MAETSIKGLEQLTRNLKRLATKDLVLAFEAGTRASAAVIAREARKRCPVGRGIKTSNTRVKSKKKRIHLRDTIRVKKMRFDGQKTRYVVHAGRGLNYAHLVEFGARPHTINPRLSGITGAIAFLAFGGRFVKSANHPGSKARPFMRPALDANYRKATDKFAIAARKKIDKLRFKK